MAFMLLKAGCMSLRRIDAVIAATLTAISTLAVPNEVQVGYGSGGNRQYGQYQAGVAGEFTLNPLNNNSQWLDLSGYAPGITRDIGVAGSFQTFCLEYTEHIYPYPAIYQVTVNQAAMSGGVGGGPSGDPLSKGTGWLYSRFAEGTLAGYSYSTAPSSEAAREASAIQFQTAIWMLEQEQPINLGNLFISQMLASGAFPNLTAAMAAGADQYGVFALNLNHTTRGRGQDQLYYRAAVPDTGATALILALSLGGMLVIRRMS